MSNGTTTWTYTYDANGMRLKRTTGTDNLSTVAATAFAAAAIGDKRSVLPNDLPMAP